MEVGMKRSFGLWQLFGFATVSLSGTLLHFLYEWSGGSPLVAPFSGVNESTWEHMKLLFWPMLIYALVESFFFKEYGNFWFVKLKGISLGLILIPVIFHTYNGVIGKSPDWVNIAIFFIAAAVAFIYETRALHEGSVYLVGQLSLSLLLIIAATFVVFTFKTPELNIFKDPVTGVYGIAT